MEDYRLWEGWCYEYQQYCQPEAATSAPFPPPASRLAALLPPEILRNIVNSQLSVQMSGRWPGRNDDGKKGVTKLSLVCRDWARVLRPMLFSDLELHIPQDVDELLNMLASPVQLAPALSACIRDVRYTIEKNQIPPWINLHKLSSIIPKASMRLCVGFSSIPGESLLKVFPRTLPSSIFPFHSIDIGHDIQFNRTNEFVSLYNQKVDDCQFSNLSIQHATTRMPMPRRRRRRPPLQQQDSWTLQKDYTGCSGSFGGQIVCGTDNVFTTHFNLVCALFRPADRLGLAGETWNSITDIVTTLVPPNFIIRYIYVGAGEQSGSESFLPHITLRAHHVTKFESTFLQIDLYKPPPRSGDRCTMNVSIRADKPRGRRSPAQTPFALWDKLGDNFLQLPRHQSLYVPIMQGAIGEKALNAILDGSILNALVAQQRLLLGRRFPPIETDGDGGGPRLKYVTPATILSTPADRVVDGSAIKLTPFERFWLLTRENTEEKCLKQLMSWRQEEAERKAEEEAQWKKQWQEVMEELLKKAESKNADSEGRSGVATTDAEQSPPFDGGNTRPSLGRESTPQELPKKPVDHAPVVIPPLASPLPLADGPTGRLSEGGERVFSSKARNEHLPTREADAAEAPWPCDDTGCPPAHAFSPPQWLPPVQSFAEHALTRMETTPVTDQSRPPGTDGDGSEKDMQCRE